MKTTAFLAVLSIMGSAHAYEAKVTKGQLAATLDSMLEKARTETGAAFEKDNFTLIEERELATSKFTMYVQTNSMIPVAKTAVRIWSNLKTNELILAEMHLDENTQAQEEALNAKFRKARFSPGAMK